MRINFRSALIAVITLTLVSCTQPQPIGPLPSWSDTASRAAIIDYVQGVSTPGSPDFIPEADRIAVFDNDGTLWAEQPMYFQLAFVFSRLADMAAQHPEWADDDDFANALSGDPERLARISREGYFRLLLATHSGMPNHEFRESVRSWIATASHPTTGQPFHRMIYKPMRELLDYLRHHDFDVYIVSGGGNEFIRAFAEDVYGVPPENVVGTMLSMEYSSAGDEPSLQRKAELAFLNDGPGKPIGIQRAIGRRPVFAFGNSDGDYEMLQWTDASSYRSFQGLVHHTDAAREWAYDRKSSIGHLEKALDQARKDDWIVVDMKADWKTIFPAAD